MRNLPALLAAGFLCAAPLPAQAHPHVFAEASLEVVVGAGGKVNSLGHVWRFDDLFSSTVLFEFDKNKDMKLDDSELRSVAETVHESLAEFGYFQFVTHDGKDVKMRAPAQLVATFDDNVLTIMFESKPEQELRLDGKVDFGVYDPTFYTAIDFSDDNLMMVQGLPASCTRAVIRPDPDEAIAQNQQTLTEAFFNDPMGNDMSKIFATRLEINCGGQG